MDHFFIQTVLLYAATVVNGQAPFNTEYTENQLPPITQPVSPVMWPIDLTHSLDELSPEWPGTAPFTVLTSTADEKRGYFYASRDISLSEHVGTHMDAPYHLNKNGSTIGNIPVSRLIARAIVVDGKSERNATVGMEDLRNWVLKNGPIPSPCVVLFRFDWSRYYLQRDIYFGPNRNTPEFPGITGELAEHIASLDAVVGVGLDTPSIDPGRETTLIAHRALAAGNKYILENLVLPMTLPPKDWTLISLPAKLTNGTGAPCRVIAVPFGFSFNTASSTAISLVFVITLPILGRLLVS